MSNSFMFAAEASYDIYKTDHAGNYLRTERITYKINFWRGGRFTGDRTGNWSAKDGKLYLYPIVSSHLEEVLTNAYYAWLAKEMLK